MIVQIRKQILQANILNTINNQGNLVAITKHHLTTSTHGVGLDSWSAENSYFSQKCVAQFFTAKHLAHNISFKIPITFI